jgi:hypothetical protein
MPASLIVATYATPVERRSSYRDRMRATSRGDIEGSPRRLWVTFERPRRPDSARAYGILLESLTTHLGDVLNHGCGVTGIDADDCWRRIRDDVFRDEPMPPVDDAVFDIDVSTLDGSWVLPRVGNPAALGVWFPAWNTRPTT